MGIPYFVIDKIYLGPVTVQVWGFMVALGFLVGLTVAGRRARRIGMSETQVLDLGILILVSALVGSRVFYVANAWEQFSDTPLAILRVWDGGLALYGGFLAAVGASVWYVRRKKFSFLRVADAFLPAVALGEAIGRVGCFLIHDHLGRITTAPWGIRVDGVLRHETALYSILASLLLFGALLALERWRKGLSAGTLTYFFLVWYGIATFAIYQLRATDLPGSDPRLGPFTPSQYFAAVLALVGIALIARTTRQTRQTRLLTHESKELLV